ncbi:hypothetical protein BJF82_05070 [Kytococcus sp. CUA-901]|nr:hypothetical protein BJF82_05070 [Kytococcus sp. CUA-901]
MVVALAGCTGSGEDPSPGATSIEEGRPASDGPSKTASSDPSASPGSGASSPAGDGSGGDAAAGEGAGGGATAGPGDGTGGSGGTVDGGASASPGGAPASDTVPEEGTGNPAPEGEANEPTGEDEPAPEGDPDLPYSVQQQMGVPEADRQAVQERLEGMLGGYAAEMTSVLPSVEPPGTQVIDRRIWPLGPTSQLVCSGNGSLTWASGPWNLLADDHTLPCTSEWGVPAVEAPRGPRADPDASGGWALAGTSSSPWPPMRGRRPGSVCTCRWPTGSRPRAGPKRALALAALGEPPATAADSGVVEFDAENADLVVAPFQAQAGYDYRLEVNCIGEGAVDLTAVVSTYHQVTERVGCGGGAAASFRAYGDAPERELHLEPTPGTRAVLSFEVVHVPE